MWIKTAAPLNSLTAKCIKQCSADQVSGTQTQRLPIHMRQAIFDYLVRERITVGAPFVRDLLQGGGVYSFDLWSLVDNNNYKANEVSSILETLVVNCASLKELVLGGSTWIYDKRVLRGPFRQLFLQKLPKLNSLKIQEVSTEEFILICEACENLVKLDIAQPSLTDRNVASVEETLQGPSCASFRRSLKELKLPSTIRNNGMLRLLSIFSNVRWFKAARFETLLETIEDAAQYDGCPLFEHIRPAETTLRQLRGLTITHPLGYDTVDTIVDTCSQLEELSLEVQDGMTLFAISRLSHLKRLEFRNSANSPASYLQEVQPLLQQIGPNLETLSLEQFDVVDLASCARLCPNLNALSAQWFTILGCNQRVPVTNMSRASREATRKPFQSLRYLRLRPRAQRQVGADAVDYLLAHAHYLEHCELYCCQDLTDDHINTIIKTNGFRELKQLILRHGHSVTKNTLNLLTARSDNLQYVDCGRPNLTKAELVPNDEEDVNLLNVP